MLNLYALSLGTLLGIFSFLGLKFESQLSLFFFFNRFNFLDKSTGLSSLFEISRGSLVDAASQSVKTSQPLHVPGVEGLIIPSGTHGHVLKMVDRNIGLVRWEVGVSSGFIYLFNIYTSVCLVF